MFKNFTWKCCPFPLKNKKRYKDNLVSVLYTPSLLITVQKSINLTCTGSQALQFLTTAVQAHAVFSSGYHRLCLLMLIQASLSSSPRSCLKSILLLQRPWERKLARITVANHFLKWYLYFSDNNLEIKMGLRKILPYFNNLCLILLWTRKDKVDNQRNYLTHPGDLPLNLRVH